MDWSSEENDGDADPDVEMEGAEAEEAKTEKDMTWSMQDLYHGLVPQELVRGWKRIFDTSTGIEQYMVDQFATSIEEFGCTEIWNNCCDVTVAWEKTIGITARNKKVWSSSG
ncbi:hypothetical protein CPB97_005842, partial [Podila verticillata]